MPLQPSAASVSGIGCQNQPRPLRCKAALSSLLSPHTDRGSDIGISYYGRIRGLDNSRHCISQWLGSSVQELAPMLREAHEPQVFRVCDQGIASQVRTVEDTSNGIAGV